MKLLIFTEGSAEIGLGHIIRCIALYQQFERMGHVPKLIIHGDQTIHSLVKKYNYSIANWLDVSVLKQYLSKKTDITIVDSYLADKNIYEIISQAAKLTVFIDDNNRLDYPKGIIVNGNMYADSLSYKKKIDQSYLLGPSYAILRNEFLNIPEKILRKQIKHILITFGGDDIRNLTPKVVYALNQKYPEIKKTVIVGTGFQNTDILLKNQSDNTQYVFNPSVSKVIELMKQADIAISGGGQTLYELARAGTPTIGITIADNQKMNVQELSKQGIVINSGMWNDVNIIDNIINCISSLSSSRKRTTMSCLGQKHIDGRGADHTVSKIISYYLRNNLNIRKAVLSDEKQILDLSNNPTIRKLSFQSKQITKKDHSIWFQKILSDNNCLFLISVVSDSIVGQIRFNIKNKEAIISISISPLYRGHKIGSMLFKKGVEILQLEYPSVHTIIALVKKENQTSQLFFEHTGFVKGEDKQNMLIYNYQVNNNNK